MRVSYERLNEIILTRDVAPHELVAIAAEVQSSRLDVKSSNAAHDVMRGLYEEQVEEIASLKLRVSDLTKEVAELNAEIERLDAEVEQLRATAEEFPSDFPERDS